MTSSTLNIEPSRPGSSNFRRGLLVCASFSILWFGSACLGQQPSAEPSPAQPDEASVLADGYIDAFVEQQRLAAGNDALKNEIERLDLIADPDSAGPAFMDRLTRADAETLDAVAAVLQDNVDPVVRDVEAASAALDQRVEEAKTGWQDVRTSLNRSRFLLFDVVASRQVAEQPASLLSVDDRWFWLSNFVAMASLLGVLLHGNRRRLRRLLSGGLARSMQLSKILFVLCVALLTFVVIALVMSDSIYESLLVAGSPEGPDPQTAIEADNAELSSQVAALEEERQTLEVQYEQALGPRQQALRGIFPAKSQFPGRAGRFRSSLIELVESLALLDGLPRAIDADLAELKKLTAELRTEAEAVAGSFRQRQLIRAGVGLALIGIAVAGGLLYLRGVKSRRRVAAATCPLCLSNDQLESAISHADNHEVPEDARLVECKAVVGQQPLEECGYAFLEAHRPMEKVCFPTLGVPQAGKTHWLAMLYWELSRRNYPSNLHFEKVKSQSAEDFDATVQDVLHRRIGTTATQQDRIPHPLVFNFRDRDRLGRSSALVNLFDFSGEVTSGMPADDYRRRRALAGDGFFFFLDPTCPSGPQEKALADFREDVRSVTGVKSSRRNRAPVAICISKIDLLAGQSHALPDGGDASSWFYEELGKIDPTGEAMTAGVIRARSRLLRGLRDAIWPDWRIEEQIGDLFGGRYMFFPLTPVGLDGLGETDLSLRTISPFGLLEPLLWLLEMNGYRVLQ